MIVIEQDYVQKFKWKVMQFSWPSKAKKSENYIIVNVPSIVNY